MVNFPPNYSKEYERRAKILIKAKNNKELQARLKTYYRSNTIDWINDFCITYNPRNKSPIPKTLPFLLFPKQIEFVEFLLECYETGQSGLLEKARDIGATWVCCAFTVWAFLFIPDISIGWGSRKELLVDRIGDPDSIFQKMRMILDNLPSWMLPAGFSLREHATYMKITNPQTGATITGEAGVNIGRGGRKSLFFKDEAAWYENPEAIEAALGDNTDVQIDISSVKPNTVFQRKREAGETWYKEHNIPRGITRVFVFDWRDHPAKTQEWYNERRDKATREGLLHLFAQEVDRDYTAALERIVIPSIWVKSAIDAHKALNFKQEGLIIGAQDIADGGGDLNALAIAQNSILLYCEAWGEGDTGETTRRAIKICQEKQVRELYYDCIGVGAGFKSESNRLIETGVLNRRSLVIQPWNAATSPLEPKENMILGDINSPLNGDFFQNLKAQAWWRLRIRFEKTYKAITLGAKYPQEELISLPSDLPNIHKLVSELSQATQKVSATGKLVIDKTPEGGRSPNMADAIVMCFNPAREISILDVL